MTCHLMPLFCFLQVSLRGAVVVQFFIMASNLGTLIAYVVLAVALVAGQSVAYDIMAIYFGDWHPNPVKDLAAGDSVLQSRSEGKATLTCADSEAY